jgi:F420-dependent oxidoreductase-like protein
MRLGIDITKFDWPGSPASIGHTLAEIAKTADDLGFYSLWVMDHLFQLGEQFGILHGPINESMIEGYSTIAYMAALTKRIKIGLLVTCVYHRHPSLLIKIISTIDVLSGGRTYLGLGAGWFEREARGLGIPVPPLRERFERLEETIQIAKQMWAGDLTPYKGKHYQLAEPLNSPQPLSSPHPPILIGGGGEKKTLRLVARYADACNLVIGAPLKEFGILNLPYEIWLDRLKHKLVALREHCDQAGRPYHEIEKTVVTYLLLEPHRQKASEVVTCAED